MRAMLAIVLFTFSVAAQAQMIVTIEVNDAAITVDEYPGGSVGGVETSDYAQVISYDWSAEVGEGTSGGRVGYGELRIVKTLARSSVFLRQAMDTSQVVDLQLRIFAPVGETGEILEIHSIALINGRVVGIRPWGDGATGQYLEEVSFSWESMEFTDVQSGANYFIQLSSLN